MARPRQTYGGHEAHPTFFEKVAALGHGIAAGHCFGNGNKRTAFVAMLQMLGMNGWVLEMPPEMVAFVMLRTASNENRMMPVEIADFLASYAFIPRTPKAVRKEYERLVQRGLAIVDGADPFPVHQPSQPRSFFINRMRATYERHAGNITKVERAELEQFGDWPLDMQDRLDRWNHNQEYSDGLLRRRRTRTKRIGKRRCPQKGGRTVSKISRPLTDEKLGLHRIASQDVSLRGR